MTKPQDPHIESSKPPAPDIAAPPAAPDALDRSLAAGIARVAADLSSNQPQADRDPISDEPVIEAPELFDRLGVNFGWAKKLALSICELNPAATNTFVDESPATRQFIGLCLAAQTQSQVRQPSLAKLAAALPHRSRRALLAELWGADLGSPRLLARLGRRLLSPTGYAALAIVLADPPRRAAFAQVGRPATLDAIHRLANSPPEAFVRFPGRAIARIGGSALSYLFAGLRTLRPDLTDADLIDRITLAAGRPINLHRILPPLISETQLPPPPWPGSSCIRPIRSVRELCDAGRAFTNCLNRPHEWAAALAGDAAYYFCDGPTPLIAGLVRHNLLRTWRLVGVEAARHKPPDPGDFAVVVAAFAEVGIVFLPDSECPVGLQSYGLYAEF